MKIAVIGDAMLDILRGGSETRLNPETHSGLAITEEEPRYFLGGAANVAAWLAADERCQVTLLAPIAPDRAGSKLRMLCSEQGIWLDRRLHTLNRTTDGSERTTTKTRVCLYHSDSPIDSVRYLARLDRDTNMQLTYQDYQIIQHRLADREFDAVVIADYDKGVFMGEYGFLLRRLFKYYAGCSLAPSSDIPVFVNAKSPEKWEENFVDFLVCNASEAEKTWGRDPEAALESIQARYLAVTAGEDGVSLVSGDRELPPNKLWLPSFVGRESLVDVCGAGDAFLAGLVSETLRRSVPPSALNTHDLLAILGTGLSWAAHCCGQIGVGIPLGR